MRNASKKAKKKIFPDTNFSGRNLLLSIFVVLTIFLNLLLHFYLIRNHAQREVIHSNALVSSINVYLSRLEEASILANTLSFSSSEQTDRALSLIKKLYHASVVFIMDAQGDVIASTPYDAAGNTLKGFNYSFRDYFKKAIEGTSDLTAAVGVTTREKGFYYSSPLVDNQDFSVTHVLVIKLPTDGISDILASDTYIHALATPDGVIFVSNNAFLLDKPMVALTAAQEKNLLDKGYWQLKYDSPLGIKDSSTSIILDGTRYYLSQNPIIIPQWRLLILSRSHPLVLTIHHLIFTLLLILIFAIIFWYLLKSRSNFTKIREQDAVIMQLRKNNIQYHALIEHVPLAIWTADFSAIKEDINTLHAAGTTDFETYFSTHPEEARKLINKGKILDVNLYSQTLYGVNSKEHLLQNTHALFSTQPISSVIHQLATIATEPDDLSGTTIHSTIDGRELQLEYHWIVPPGHEKDWAEIFVILINITPQIALQNELLSSKESLRLINKTLRHDLINNLSVIHSALKMNQQSINRSMLAEAREKVTKSINLLKDMRQLESQSQNPHGLSIFELREVLEKVISSHTTIPISIRGTGEVYADSAIYSVLDNIVSNAVKHSGTDRIDITVDQNQNLCIVRIVDYGRGIPDEMKTAIFEEGFHYGPSGRSGIGLYIVKKTIERYYGSVHVEDADPRGTAVVISLRSYK